MLLAALGAAFVAAAIAPLGYRRWPRATAWAAVGLSTVLAALFVAWIPAIADGEAPRDALGWAPTLGIELALRLDGLALAFAVLVTGIGTLVLVYTVGYLGHGPRLGRMLGLLLLFEAAMLGLVLADDTITLVVFWELTSISSFFLIAFDDTSARARRNATQALVITGAGGLVLLVGVLLLAQVAGTGASVAPSQLARIEVRDHALYPTIVVLIAVAAFTKSAQLPFHSWLPSAMIAPTPVSAYLHSAAMVKAGVYVLARFAPALGGTPLWTGLLVIAGGVTAVHGSAVAILQRDLKLTLAYATIAILGMLTVLVGNGSDHAVEAFVVLLLAHAAYKAALFMVAGNIDHHRGRRDPFALRRLAGEMPGSAIAAVLAAASMAGLPPLLGFLGKEATYLAAVTGPSPAIVGAAIVIGGTLLVSVAWIVAFEPFLRGGIGRLAWRDAPATMLVPPLVLAGFGLVVAFGGLLEPLVAPAAEAIAGREIELEVALWSGASGAHGLVLVLGGTSIVAGTVAYLVIARHADAVARGARLLGQVSADRGYDALAAAGTRASARLAALLVHAPLRGYVAMTIAVAACAAGVPLAVHLAALTPTLDFAITVGEAGLFLVAGAGAIGAVLAHRRLVAVASIGATGLAITVLFALFSAPDLAITQVMVETLMVILLVAVFRHLPPTMRRETPERRVAMAALAGTSGLVVAVLLLAATSTTGFSRDASATFVGQAETSNIVNAILVEFRAFDTLGEITVLATAGLGVLALLRLRLGRREAA